MEEAGERYTDFNMVSGEGRPEVGSCHARGVNADLPPVWMICLPVGDHAESLVRMEEESGEVLRTMTGENCGLVYVAIQDPVRAWLALVPGGS